MSILSMIGVVGMVIALINARVSANQGNKEYLTLSSVLLVLSAVVAILF